MHAWLLQQVLEAHEQVVLIMCAVQDAQQSKV